MAGRTQGPVEKDGPVESQTVSTLTCRPVQNGLLSRVHLPKVRYTYANQPNFLPGVFKLSKEFLDIFLHDGFVVGVSRVGFCSRECCEVFEPHLDAYRT